MGKLKSYFSSTGWETSEFGGFSRILWDLPDMDIPYGFNIKTEKDVEYLGPYVERKLLALFLYKVNHYKIIDSLLKDCNSFFEEKNAYGDYKYKKQIFKFSKNSIKSALNSLIAREVELKSLFINYSNLLCNSYIFYENPNREQNISAGEEQDSFLSDAISKISERKKFYYGSYNCSITSIDELKKKSKFIVFDDEDLKSIPKVVYSKDEVLYSDKLLDSLDISFEQGCSKITNLRCGKLDLPKLCESLSGNTNIYFKKEFYEKTKPFSICILCDESGSMEGSKYYKQHKLVRILYRAFSAILPASKLYVYGHTGEDNPVIHVYQDKYNPYFEETFNAQHDRIFVQLEQNYDGPVTDLIYEKIRLDTDDNILFIVVSDGEPCGYRYGSDEDFTDFKRIIEKCKRDGFVTCGIGMEYLKVKDIYQYSTVINTSDDYIKNVSTLINSVVKSEFQ